MKKVLLAILLLLGFFVNFFPHLNYNYPLHVDEWVHFTYSQHISDGSPLYFGGESNSLEHGFHLLLATLNSLGVPYLFMFEYFASFLFVLILLSVFILTRKYFDEWTALFSVLFLVLLKSSVQLLGPVFLVPMAVGLFLIPMGLFFVGSKLLFLIISGILIIHPPSGIALIILLGCYSLLNPSRIKRVLIQGVLGIVLSLPLFVSQLMKRGLSNLSFNESLINVLFIPKYLGYVVTAFVIIGVFAVVYKKRYLFALYSMLLLVLTVLYYNFSINLLIMYERNLMYLFLSFSVLFGAGCVFVANFTKYKKIALVCLIVIFALMLPAKINSDNFYHLIDDEDYNNFVNAKGSLGLVDPAKAIAFTPLAKIQVYTRIVQGREEVYSLRNKEVIEYLYNNCTDTNFLTGKNIDYVYRCS